MSMFIDYDPENNSWIQKKLYYRSKSKIHMPGDSKVLDKIQSLTPYWKEEKFLSDPRGALERYEFGRKIR